MLCSRRGGGGAGRLQPVVMRPPPASCQNLGGGGCRDGGIGGAAGGGLPTGGGLHATHCVTGLYKGSRTRTKHKVPLSTQQAKKKNRRRWHHDPHTSQTPISQNPRGGRGGGRIQGPGLAAPVVVLASRAEHASQHAGSRSFCGSYALVFALLPLLFAPGAKHFY